MNFVWKKDEVIREFQTCCPEFFNKHRLERFQFFYYPVSIAEVDVKEYIIEEYESVELLVLQLFDAEITAPEDIQELTGLDAALVSRILYNERYVYGHIVQDRNELTDMGRKTLEENADQNGTQVIQHALYDVKREIQIEALTGTVIPAKCEKNKKKLLFNVGDGYSRLLPRETVQIDKELSREISQRLEEYKHFGILNNGNTVHDIGDIHTREIRFGRAFLAEFCDLPHPMVIIEGYEADEKNGKRKRIYMPSALSAGNAREIRSEGVDMGRYLIRDNEYFQYLMENKEKIKETADLALANLEQSEQENQEGDIGNEAEVIAAIENINELGEGGDD